LLQFSENITLFEVCRIYTGVISKETRHQVFGAIYIVYVLYNVGYRTEPCGTPAWIFLGIFHL
jgi:hypothetical protein